MVSFDLPQSLLLWIMPSLSTLGFLACSETSTCLYICPHTVTCSSSPYTFRMKILYLPTLFSSLPFRNLCQFLMHAILFKNGGYTLQAWYPRQDRPALFFHVIFILVFGYPHLINSYCCSYLFIPIGISCAYCHLLICTVFSMRKSVCSSLWLPDNQSYPVYSISSTKSEEPRWTRIFRGRSSWHSWAYVFGSLTKQTLHLKLHLLLKNYTPYRSNIPSVQWLGRPWICNISAVLSIKHSGFRIFFNASFVMLLLWLFLFHD